MYKKLFSCENKVAVVTGGLGLIGREIVQALRDHGTLVYVADIGDANGIFEDVSNLKFMPMDITSEKSINDTISIIAEENGCLDIIVNSAYPKTADWGLKLEQIPFESWNDNMKSHLGGYFLCSRVAAEQMKKQKSGSIINMASIYGVVGPDFSIYDGTEMTMPAAYSAIKGGVIAITKYLATYYGKYKVRANTISAGGIFDNQPESFVEKYSMKTPLGRMGKPHDLVGAIVFLASDASSYVTGQNILVDGGWTAW